MADEVGLGGSAGDDGVGAGGEDLGEEIFELATLVSAAAKAGEVVTFGPEVDLEVFGHAG